MIRISLIVTLIVALAAVSFAQPQLPGGRKIEIPVGAPVLKVDPAKVPGLLSPVSPGVGGFEVRGVDSDLCVGYRTASPRVPYMALAKCEMAYDKNTAGSSQISVVPHPQGGFTLRLSANFDDVNLRPNPATWLQTCLTGARGVLLGARSIDALPCDTGSRSGVETLGGLDQRFTFIESRIHVTSDLGDRYFNIVSYEDNTKCLDVRGSGKGVGTELILWDCNAQKNQLFQFRARHPLASMTEVEMAGRMGYMSGSAVLPFRDSPSTRSGILWRSVPVAGYDIPGGDLGGTFMNTENDNGAACAKACALSDECRAFTWVRPGVQGDRARCWLKRSYGSVVTNPGTASGIVRPSGK